MEFRLMAWAVDTGPDLPQFPGLNTQPPPAQEENIEDFFVRRLRLVFRATVSKSLDLYAHFSFDNSGSKILRDDAGVRIKEAYVNYHPRDGFQVVFGQFKIPFLRQNLTSGFYQMLVDRGFVTALNPGIEEQSDQGGMAWGSKGGFQYRTALFDGSDQEDVNTASSLRGAARVAYNWFTPEPGLAYGGTSFGRKRVLQIAGQIDAQNGRVDARDDPAFATEPRAYHAWAAEVFYDQPFAGRWAVTTEAAWLQRRDDYETEGLETRRIEAGYGEAGLLMPWQVGPGRLQLAGRLEDIRTTRGTEESTARVRTFGLTWTTRGHERKIQFDHGDVHERPTDLDDNFYRLSAVVVF